MALKILITGGSGFLGSALTRYLYAAGYQVSLLLRPSSKLERLQGLKESVNLYHFVSDADIDVAIQCAQPDVVIHTACAYGRQGENFLYLADTNIRFGLRILQSLIDLGRPTTFLNTGTVLEPDVSLYALTKHQFSQWGRTLVEQSAGQIRFVNILLQHMYGPGDDASKFTTHVLHACHRNDLEIKLTAGEQKRDFIYINDVVGAYATLIKCCEELELFLNVEVGSGVAPSIRDFVETVHRLTQSKSQLHFGAIPYRHNEAMHCQADLSLMHQIGWMPNYDLEAGLKKTIEMEFSK